jgi:hypothetical protein
VLAVLHDIGHLEHAEFGRHRRHHRRGQREGHLAQLQLLQQLAVLAELAGAEGLHLGAITQLAIGAFGECVGRCLEQRAGVADMAEAKQFPPAPSAA